MALMTSTGQLGPLTTLAIRELLTTSLQERSNELLYSQLGFQDFTPDHPEQQTQAFSGPGRGQVTVEGEEFKSNELYRSFPVTSALTYYTSKLSYTKADLHWLNQDLKGGKQNMQFKSIVNNAVNAVHENINEDAAKVFHLGYGTTFLDVGNAEALYAAHSIRKDGSTFRNTFTTTHKSLSSASLKEAIFDRMARVPAHNGVVFRAPKRVLLLVGTELYPTALSIVNSDYGPNNPNLGLQVSGPTLRRYAGLDIQVVNLGSYMPSDKSTYWSVVDLDRAAEGNYLEWGWRPEMDSEPVITNGTYNHVVDTMFGPKVVAWWAHFGSQGTDNPI